MNRRLVDALTQLYPTSWRRRYAAEFSAFLEESKCGIRDVADILWSALREHLLSKGEREMNRSQHASGFLAFSFLAALAAGINLVMTVDDSPLTGAMRSHLGMSVAWNLLAGAAVLSGIGVLSIVFSLYRSMLFYARRASRRDIIALLSVPFIGAGALLLWGVSGLAYTGGRWAASPWAILGGGGAPSFWPSLHARWICGIISVVLSFTVAIASTISVHLAIRRTDFELASGTTLRKRRTLAELAKPLVVICTVVMFLSVLAWGLALQRSVPSLFRQHVGLLDGTAATSWVISLSLLGLASAICIRTNLNLKNAHRPEFFAAAGAFWQLNVCLCVRMYTIVLAASLIANLLITHYGQMRKWLEGRESWYWKFIRRLLATFVLPRIAEWHLILSPVLLASKELTIEVDVLAKNGILYAGRLADKVLTASGDLQSVTLGNPRKFKRKEYLKDKKADPSVNSDKYWKPITGQMFVIVASEISTLNVRHIPAVPQFLAKYDDLAKLGACRS